MKIVKLQVKNVQKVKAVEIVPTENTVVISGANAQGKSSILNSIEYAFGGKRALKNVTKPIREGQSYAHVVVELDDCIVTRIWTSNDKSTLKIENKDGVVFKSPQAMMDHVMGKFSFDPLEFSRMSAKEQMEVLIELIDLDIDLNQLDEERQETYDLRTMVNRNVKKLEGHLHDIPFPHPDLPNEEISPSDVMNAYKEATETLNANNQEREKLIKLDDKKSIVNSDITTLENQIQNLKEHLDIKYQTAMDLEDELIIQQELVDALVDPNIDEFKSKLESVESENKLIRNAIEWRRLKQDVEDQKAKSQSLTDKIGEIDNTKQSAIESANMPIQGLGFNDDGVTFNDVPFVQCSAAEQLKISLSIAMALNPKLRVIRIMDGSLLDSSNMDIIKEMANDKDYQVWLEVVDESGKLGIFIENGDVSKDNYK